MPPPDAAPAQTQQEWLRAQANEAWRAAEAASAGGDGRAARRWLERAHRIAPHDAVLALALAGAWLRDGALQDAASLLEDVLERHESRETWLALAAARHARGDVAASGALRHALAHFVLPAGAAVAGLADAITARAGLAGWCGLDGDGRIVAQAKGRVAIRCDGRTLRPRAHVPWPAARVEVTLAGAHLLGSPLDIRALRRVEGVVDCEAGGLAGWAWHPADPDRDPVLRIAGPGGGFNVVAHDQSVTATAPLARPRGFRVPAAALAALDGVLDVRGQDGQPLLGSPLDPRAERRSAAAAARRVAQRFPALGPPVEAAADDPALPAIPLAAGWPPGEVQGQGQGQDQGRGHDQGRAGARPAPHRRLAVVIPVHRGLEVTRDCLEAVLATVPRGCRVIVVDDATPEPALAALLDGLARRRRIRLLRNVANRGFPASANAGLRAAATLRGRPDVVLLNSDTRVTAGWIEGLRAVVQGGPDIGTATPLSNDATIMSYPASATAQPAPDAPAQAALARLVAAAAGGAVIDLPTAVGFCMYIRRECLLEVGLFREDVFAQGYGEENDFCLRARHLGWRHVGVPGIYVAHAGAQSFGPARAHLVARNLAVLERLHPGYAALIAAFEAADPLAAIRRRLDFARWRTGRRRAGAVILVTHDSGGGVERVVQARCATLRAAGRRAILLRPVKAREGAATYREGLCAVAEAGGPDYPDLRFAIPDEIPAMLRLLRGERATHMEVHHLLGHHHGLLDLAARLDIPVEQHVHDYALLCPRIALVGRDGRYCGEPEEVAACEACIADAGRKTEEEIGVAALRARSAADLAAARRVVVPSGDAAARLGRYFPGLRPDIAPLEAEAAPPARMAVPIPGARRLVCVIGAIGPEKGYDVLLACARDAAARDLPLGFTLVGHTPDDARLLATGRVFVTGPYREAEAVRLIAAQQAQLAFLPSIWPETWCFTLGLAWRAGLAVAAFDLGAPAERIRARGGGWLLPLGLPPASINAALLAV